MERRVLRSSLRGRRTPIGAETWEGERVGGCLSMFLQCRDDGEREGSSIALLTVVRAV